ncbi:universal stress protein [Streptomyces misionensis]|uniref:Universal stress protein n=1 Tax=Streptomyces misionensis TaxID=67331 RepID=A0A5C6JZZ5_9ACTN|nr:universal stress protein [Streptomyces misionensis]TWV56340.1 universal stress protein [Streptomyces misionensis]
MNNEAAAPPRIVVGVDGSEQSKAAVRWAVNQAKLIGGAVDAILAWDLPTPWHGLVSPTEKESSDYAERMRTVLDQAIDEALGPGPGRPVPLRATSSHGHPAAVLLDAAEGADLLVVGNRGRGEIRGTLLGSVGMHCVQHAPCPVVVIRGAGNGG